MAGRKNKILKYGLQDTVERLRSTGLSYKAIAKTINLEHSIDITQSTIQRYFAGKNVQIQPKTPIEIVQEFKGMIADITFKIDTLDSLSKRDRKAIMTYIPNRRTWFETRLRRSKGVDTTEGSGYTKEWFDGFLIALSNELCSECGKRVSKLASGVIESRKHTTRPYR